MKLHWPPRPLGFGTLLNLALLLLAKRAELARGWWLAPLTGLGIALAIIAVDYAFFDGVTMRRTPDLSAHPPVGSRVLVAFAGSLFEELVFRAGIATAGAWLVHLMLRRVAIAEWTGILLATVAIGLMHVGQVGNSSQVWRVVTVNTIGNLVYGWLYWRRGLELAVLSHAVVTLILYIGIPALR